MGVPSFYRWLSKRYPKCVEYVKEDPHVRVNGVKVPIDASKENPNGIEFDNLYLDMNGIIHPASHPEDGPAPETEDDMYIAIFEYIDRVFACVRPRKLLFMAIDGVAPRSKMNQQRSRRFRAAQEREETMAKAEELRQEMRSRGVPVPDAPEDPPFDSNVITPGTPFMARLATYLRWYIRYKIQNDSGWRKIKVILSDASIPGEGEHKIMDYIRLQRAHTGYDVNTRHVIHGLDADLIMLALATHEPHFFILREEFTFGKPKEQQDQVMEMLDQAKEASAAKGPEAVQEEEVMLLKPFQFIKISVLREYLEKEFRPVDFRSVGGFDLERVIDDFILMCFFVGNDFLPHLPTMEIREGAIDTILDLYKSIFPELGGWMTAQGEVRMKAVQKMMFELGTIENEVLRKRKLNEDRFDQRQKLKKLDVKNKKTGNDHLELIRRLTTDVASHATPLGVGAAQSHLEIHRHEDGGPAKRPKLSYDTQASVPSDVGENAFEIKHRAAGGVRVLIPGASEQDARLLHLFDKVREFAKGKGKSEKMPLKNLSGFERRRVHDYCEELGLRHQSKGEDPNRYIVVEHMGEESFDDALKKKMMDANDKIAETMIDEVKLGEDGWKDRYYKAKVPNDDRKDLARSYLEGLMWVMKYYYKGCPSWNWFYPYHYAPFASDLVDLEVKENPFEMGEPFLPFEQLMAVFPPASSHALPMSLAALMNEDSVIGEFYPSKFDLDLNGKRRLWQAIVLLPFINEKKLLGAVRPLEEALEGEEKGRNRFKFTHLFAHDNNPIAEQLRSAREKVSLPPPPSIDHMKELAAAVSKAKNNGDEIQHEELKAELQKTRDAAATYLKAVEESKKCVHLDPSKSNGMNGTVFKDPSVSEAGTFFQAPSFTGRQHSHPYKPNDIPDCHVHCVIYKFPEFRPHKTTLLPNVQLPPAELSDTDLPEGETHFVRVRKSQDMYNPYGGPRAGPAVTRMIRHNLPGPGRGPNQPPRREYGTHGYEVQPGGGYPRMPQYSGQQFPRPAGQQFLPSRMELPPPGQQFPPPHGFDNWMQPRYGGPPPNKSWNASRGPYDNRYQ